MRQCKEGEKESPSACKSEEDQNTRDVLSLPILH